MKKLTTTSYAVLSLLAIRTWSAYELSQEMRRNLGAIWPRAERGIYDEAKNLVAHGLARADDEPRGRQARTRYTITRSGRKALAGWLASPQVDPPQIESEALLRIAFAEHGTAQDALRTLGALREQTAAQREFVANVARQYAEGRGTYPERAHVISLVSRFLADYDDMVDRWAEWAADQIEDWGDVSRPPDGDGPLATLAELGAVRPVRA